eukprot:1157509-Pelagomonas_calceolata.AAC.6
MIQNSGNSGCFRTCVVVEGVEWLLMTTAECIVHLFQSLAAGCASSRLTQPSSGSLGTCVLTCNCNSFAHWLLQNPVLPRLCPRRRQPSSGSIRMCVGHRADAV